MPSLPRRPRLPLDAPRVTDEMPSPVNHAGLTGSLVERGPLRYTPAGIPVLEFRIDHCSEQVEAETIRRVECEMACVALGTNALLLKEAMPGRSLSVEGFLAAKSVKQRAPVLHVTRIGFVEKI